MLHVQPSWFWSCSSHKEISFVLPTPCRQAGRPHLLKLSPKTTSCTSWESWNTVLNGILAISTGTRCSTSISVLKLVLIWFLWILDVCLKITGPNSSFLPNKYLQRACTNCRLKTESMFAWFSWDPSVNGLLKHVVRFENSVCLHRLNFAFEVRIMEKYVSIWRTYFSGEAVESSRYL